VKLTLGKVLVPGAGINLLALVSASRKFPEAAGLDTKEGAGTLGAVKVRGTAVFTKGNGAFPRVNKPSLAVLRVAIFGLNFVEIGLAFMKPRCANMAARELAPMVPIPLLAKFKDVKVAFWEMPPASAMAPLLPIVLFSRDRDWSAILTFKALPKAMAPASPQSVLLRFKVLRVGCCAMARAMALTPITPKALPDRSMLCKFRLPAMKALMGAALMAVRLLLLRSRVVTLACWASILTKPVAPSSPIILPPVCKFVNTLDACRKGMIKPTKPGPALRLLRGQVGMVARLSGNPGVWPIPEKPPEELAGAAPSKVMVMPGFNCCAWVRAAIPIDPKVLPVRFRVLRVRVCIAAAARADAPISVILLVFKLKLCRVKFCLIIAAKAMAPLLPIWLLERSAEVMLKFALSMLATLAAPASPKLLLARSKLVRFEAFFKVSNMDPMLLGSMGTPKELKLLTCGAAAVTFAKAATVDKFWPVLDNLSLPKDTLDLKDWAMAMPVSGPTMLPLILILERFPTVPAILAMPMPPMAETWLLSRVRFCKELPGLTAPENANAPSSPI
jgi:hypothetical protein